MCDSVCESVCESLGIELLWAVVGGKVQSSSDLVESSGMVSQATLDDEDLQPDVVEIVSSSSTT